MGGETALERVLVAGISGAGKTTLARRVGVVLDLPVVEVDALRHGPGWAPLPTFAADLRALAAQERWIADSAGYPEAIELLWPRADTVVWLDLPRARVMARVIRRSFGRALTRRELWNGNREDFRNWLDPEHPIRWAWTQHGPRRRAIAAMLAAPGAPACVHLRTPREVREWVRSLQASGAGRSASTTSSSP
jgi:adenylate kinase family enzyme